MARTLTLRLALTSVSAKRANATAKDAAENRGSNRADTDRNAALLARCEILSLLSNAKCDAVEVTDLFPTDGTGTAPYYMARRVMKNRALSAYSAAYTAVTMRNVEHLSAAVVRGERITDSYAVRVFIVRNTTLAAQ